MNATLKSNHFLFRKPNNDFISYTRFPVNKINVEKIFKIMRKLLFNYSFYSHPEIGKFQGVTVCLFVMNLDHQSTKGSPNQPL
jgi:hypothetical protein